MGKRIFFQIYPGFLIIIALTIIPTAWFATRIFREFHIETLRNEVLVRANMMNREVANAIGTDHFIETCTKAAERANVRLSVIAPGGTVLFDSEGDYKQMPDHGRARPELEAALRESRNGTALRYSVTLMKEMLYAAEPLYNEKNELIGAIRLSLPVETVDTNIGKLNFKLIFFAFFLAVLSGLIGLLISRRISRPIEDIRLSVVRMAKGDLDRKIHPTCNMEEINDLAEAVNSLAVQLKLRISDIVCRKNELSTILSSMTEGVIAFDTDFRIIIVNTTAARMFGLNVESASGHTLYELFRNPHLHEFAESLLASRETKETEIECSLEEKHILVTRGSIMIDEESGMPSGAVIVMTDITRMRQLEKVRRDFVANVSHEIKTPITAIKASLEAMEAMNGELPPSAEKFLQIIERHADRLSALVGDVLSLSALESNRPGHEMLVSFQNENLHEILSTACELCGPKAEAEHVRVTLNCPEDLTIFADASLLDQAVVNLIDNAIKYSPLEDEISVSARHLKNGETEIRIQDHGCGIDPKEHSRIFERFYRVDKARSRKLGGTGLGLAIVKHIAQAHGGTVRLESELGKGAIFILTLPPRKV